MPSYVEASSTRTISLRIFAGVLRITEIILKEIVLVDDAST
jgi:hypothetical protein